jgi:phospholipid/cholesterol/gamma-HCH transport system substrate-binding protein
MAERSLRLRLGLFVAATLGVLAALVVLFGGTPGMFSNTTRYTVLFPEAPGVTVGTPVRKSGVRIGEVTALDLDEETGQVRVGVRVEPKHLPRTGEDPVITRGLLSGDTTLDFVPKLDKDGNPVPRGDRYPPGSDIQGVSPPSTRALLTQASTVLPTAQESLLKISASFERFQLAVPKLEKTADEFAALARGGRELIPELRQTNTKVQELLGADAPPADPTEPQPATVRALLKEIIDLLQAIRPVADDVRTLVTENGPELNKALKSANDVLGPENRKAVSAAVKNIEAASDDLTKTIRLAALLLDSLDKTVKTFNDRLTQSERALGNIEKITRPAAENADQVVKDVADTARNLSAASAQLSRTLEAVQDTLKVVNRSDGTLSKVLTDPSLYNNLNDATVGLARLLARAEKIARDLEVFADKIARRPETLGVGGVVKPSTGLKEAPDAPLPPSPLQAVPPVPPPPGPVVAPIPPVSSYKPPAPDLPPLPPGK